MKYLIDSLVSDSLSSASSLIKPLIAAGGLVVNILFLDTLVWRCLGEIRQRYVPLLLNRLDQSLLSYLLCHSYQFFNNHMSGSLAKNMFHLLNGIEKIITTSVSHILRALSVLVVSCVCAWYVSPWICLIMSVWFVIFFSNNIRMSKRLMVLSQEQAACEALLGGQITDSLTQSSAVRLFAQRHGELDRRTPALNDYQKAYQRKENYSLRLSMIQGCMIALMIGLALVVLLWLYRQHKVSVGDFALIVGLIMEMGHILWHTMAEVQEFNKERGRCDQSLLLLLQPHDIIDRPQAKALKVVQGEITFRHVNFVYPNSPQPTDHHDTLISLKPLFQNVSVTIKGGQKVGLVGYSGGGKTSFVSLILRLYDVTEGAVLIDGHDVRDITQDSLRQHIAMIPQDPSLFHRTLMDNIRYGRPDASDADVVQAATLAHAHEFITQLPQGYQSLVGDRGVKLSGGQRQRIAIARAMLKNAPILILDEATSQLDSVTENGIQESLLRLFDDAVTDPTAKTTGKDNDQNHHSSPSKERKTVLVIAHRLSTLLHMDRILVFDKGCIVQDGTHSDLLSQEGLYQTLWSAQVGDLITHEDAGASSSDSWAKPAPLA
jgi:ATP-binding cassette subfamily B protein